MAVKRIVTNIAAGNLQAAQAFYGDILDLLPVMDHGWIVTFAAGNGTPPQISISSEGGSGAPVPDLSIEVDNFEEVLARIQVRGFPLEYGPAVEP